MAFYCQCMLEMSLILCEYDAMYEEIAFKFVQHFMWISYAMDKIGECHDDMWDEQDGFFYDVLRLPGGQATRLKVRSLVGLLPLCASTIFEEGSAKRYPKLVELIKLFRERHPELVLTCRRPPTVSWDIEDGGCCRSSTRPSSREFLATCLMRMSFWDRTEFVLSLAIIWIIPSRFGLNSRNTRFSTCRLNRIQGCSEGTPTGGVPCGCPSMC